MTDTIPIKILLAEDDDDLRESLVDCLELHGYVITGVPNALSFYQTISTDHFDIAIIDIGLPDQSGLEIVSHMNQNSTMGIVVLTAMGSPELRTKGYECGADLYLVKPVECRELAAALANLSVRLVGRASHPDSASSSPWILNIVALQLVTPAGIIVPIAAREAVFLKLLMAQAGEPVGRLVTCRALDFESEDSNDRRMDSMIRRLRKKVKVGSGFDLPIKTIYGKGYVFSGYATIF